MSRGMSRKKLKLRFYIGFYYMKLNFGFLILKPILKNILEFYFSILQ